MKRERWKRKITKKYLLITDYSCWSDLNIPPILSCLEESPDKESSLRKEQEEKEEDQEN